MRVVPPQVYPHTRCRGGSYDQGWVVRPGVDRTTSDEQRTRADELAATCVAEQPERAGADVERDGRVECEGYADEEAKWEDLSSDALNI